MNKKLLAGAVAFVLGGIFVKVTKDAIVKRKELIEGAMENNELQD